MLIGILLTGYSADGGTAIAMRCSKRFSLGQNVCLAAAPSPSSTAVPLPGGWQLVKTTEPRSGSQLISVMRVADTAQSDLNFAGFTLRCGRLGIEAVLIVLDPLSPGSKVPVSVKSGSQTSDFEATSMQGGEALLLPPAATIMAHSEWQSSSELTIDIAAKPTAIHGVIPMYGLSEAVTTLAQNCSPPG